MKNWLKLAPWLIVGGGTYFGTKALVGAVWGHVWAEWLAWAAALCLALVALLASPDQRWRLVGPKGARTKHWLMMLGQVVFLMIVVGGASLGAEALVGAAWAGWLAGAVGLCGVLALVVKLEKNGLFAEVQPAGKVGDMVDGPTTGA